MLSSDALSCSMSAISIRKAERQDTGECCISTVKELRALLVRRKERPCTTNGVIIAQADLLDFEVLKRGIRFEPIPHRCAFVSNPFRIAVHSDSSIELPTSNKSVLSPCSFPKPKGLAASSRGHRCLAGPNQDAVTLDSTEEPLPVRLGRLVLYQTTLDDRE
jgi:hypothetical protein